MFGNKKEKKSAEKIQVHFVFVEEPLDKVAPSIMGWEESPWWPKKSGLTVTRKTPGPIQLGTVWEYKLPFLKAWTVEVAHFTPNRVWASTFKSGILQGAEAVRIEERANGTKIEYQIRYQVKGLLNRFLWMLLGERPHNNAIKKILSAFRDHVIQKSKQEQEKRFEGQA